MSDFGVPPPAEGHAGLRLLALTAVSAGLLLLAAAAFVLSYPGVHAVALSAGVSPQLARIYPVIFDAMLVIACSAVLSLRGAGLPSRCYAWLCLLVLLFAVAYTDAVHATNAALPHRPAAVAAAVIPWALVLIGLSLLVTMLRHARLRHTRLPALAEEPAGIGGLAALGFGPAPPALLAGFGNVPGPEYAAELEPAAEAEPGRMTTAEVEAAAEVELWPEDAADLEPAAEAEPGPPATAEPEPEAESAAGAAAEPAAAPGAAPPLDRVRSSPVPPEC
jgi:hypothetical protein